MESRYKRIVIKVGTTTITLDNGRVNLRWLDKFSWVLTALRNQGKEVILVSSGAIAVGADRLELNERPRDTAGKQAASAVGQAVLMQIYINMFAAYNQKIAQVLLTPDVLENETRKTNARNTLFTLLDIGVVPIVNANDTVSTDELGFSENDTLSALVAGLTDSDLLIMLSDIDGLYDADPRVNPNARLLEKVSAFNKELEKMAAGSGSIFGTGGMITKVYAAKIAAEAGIDTIIGSGSDPGVIFDMLEGGRKGTLLVADRER
jgi:glutamate 5-kinase